MRFFPTACVILGVCTAAFAQAPKPGLDKAKIESYIRHVELLPNEMKIVIGDPKPSAYTNFQDLPVEVTTQNGIYALHYYLSNDGKFIVKGNLFDTTKPAFEGERKLLKTAGQPNFGTPGAPVTIVVFSDFQCPNCREEAKVIHEQVAKAFPKETWVFFKDFPLESMHPWAKPAAMAGRCIFRQQPNAFWDFHDWIYEHQADINVENLKTHVMGFAETKKIDPTALGKCIDSNATEIEVNREIAEGRLLGVSGTPTIFINGRPLTGAVPFATLEQIIKIELEYAKKFAKADEKCCEVSLPSAVK